MDLIESEVQTKLSENTGDPIFAQYADQLRRTGRWQDGLKVALCGLSASPDCHRGRLVLARIFYDARCFPFAIRELQYLHAALPDNASVMRLLERLAPQVLATPSAVSNNLESAVPILAEGEFDIDDLNDE